MFDRDVVLLDYTTHKEWPKDVETIVLQILEDYSPSQDTIWPMSLFIDEIDDDVWVDDVPVNSPVYKWLTENNVDYRRAYLHVWW